MKPLLPAIALLIGLPVASPAAENDNPFKNVKEGDWVTFAMTMEIGDFKVAGECKKTVTAKTDKEVTIKIVTTLNGTPSLPTEEKVDLTKPYEATRFLGLDGARTKIEKLGDGKEKVRVGAKEYECALLKLKTKSKGVPEYPCDVKLWTNKDVPLGGMVKLEVLGERGVPANTWLEFKASGSK